MVGYSRGQHPWYLQLHPVRVPYAYHRAQHLQPLFTSFSVPELLKSKGQVVVLTSAAAQYRLPAASEYCISKLAINRLAEFVTVGEYPYVTLENGRSSPPSRVS